MCKKGVSKKIREGRLRPRLLKKWVKRIHATGAWPAIDALEDTGKSTRTPRYTPTVTAESTPPDSRLYKQFQGQSRTNMRRSAAKAGQGGRKGRDSVFGANRSAGQRIGDPANAIDGVNAVATASVDAPDSQELDEQRQALFNSHGVDIDSTTGDVWVRPGYQIGAEWMRLGGHFPWVGQFRGMCAHVSACVRRGCESACGSVHSGGSSTGTGGQQVREQQQAVDPAMSERVRNRWESQVDRRHKTDEYCTHRWQ
jgi:hypothetical protein